MNDQPVPPARALIRVLHVAASREWRGGERQLLLLAAGLRQRGIEPLVAARHGSPLLHRLKNDGVATAALQMQGSLSLLTLRRLRSLIATWRPDIVHAHDRRAHVLAVAALVGRGGKIPLVVTRRLARPPRGLMRVGPRVARFIAISEAVKEALIAGGVSPGRIALAYPGVSTQRSDVARDWRSECDWPIETVVAGVVGPITRDREEESLVRLMGLLPRSTIDRLGLVLLGGSSAGRTTIAGVRSFRAGFVHEVPQALAGLDLILHPGGAEGLGTAVVEGMALGVPTIAFASGGLPEVIEHDRNGLLIPASDRARFAAAITSLVEDPTRRRAIGAAGPQRATRFSSDRMVDAVVAIYSDLIERSMV